MMKKLIFIGGPAGVGKTTCAKLLVKALPNSVYFDGDWAWDLHPFTVNDENKKMVHENITFILKQFLKNSQIENIVFTWVMHEQFIIDDILSSLTEYDFQLFNFSLIADEATIRVHFINDPERDENGESLQKSLSYLTKYDLLNTIKIDRTDKNVDDTVTEILEFLRFSEGRAPKEARTIE